MDWNERRARLKAIIDERLDFELKGKSIPYTSANGHMFSQLNKDAELGIRLSPEDRASFEAEHGESEFRSYGSVMREYVVLPDALWDDDEAIAGLLEHAHDYVMGLPSK